MESTSATTREFTLPFLEQITDNFSEKHIIGRGGYGVVYKGVLDNGEEIALKKLHHMPGLDDTQFRNEFNNLMRVQHQNITRLVGYCYNIGHQRIKYNGEYIFALVEERVLCFEYLQGGSLDKYISDESCGLDWHMRFNIIKGVCEGLNYLHNGSKDPIYHLDLKPANILLDKNMVPKIGDFGLSRLFPSSQTYITTKIIGTPGYMPPEYIERYEITSKFDVFSLGVIIMRISAGDEGYSKCARMSSQEFLEHVHGNRGKRLQTTMSSHASEQVKTCIEIALRCVEVDRVKRPTVAEIVDELSKVDTAKSSPTGQIIDFRSKQALEKQCRVSDIFSRLAVQLQSCHTAMRPMPIKPGTVQLVIRNNKEAPFEENSQKVMLELTGGDYTSDRPGLDLVAVLDVSDSMAGEKIVMLQTAMQFVLQKLDSSDCLSIVTFSTTAKRLFPLWHANETSKREMQELINGLHASGSTNISDGLQTGLEVLENRMVSGRRVTGIMLMSGSEQNQSSDAAQVTVGNVPVYTFGFGGGSDPMLLNTVAAKSMGGTFSAVQDYDSLTVAFSQCLAGLLTVAVKDLELTVARIGDESMIQKVTAGSYPQRQRADPGLVTVSFGNLYSREVRNVIVDLLLPAIEGERSTEILKVSYSYKSSSGRLFDAAPETLTVRRTGLTFPESVCAELLMEETRLHTARMIKEIRIRADGRELDSARSKLRKALLYVHEHHSNPLLMTELLKLLATPESYGKHGRSYALSSETSHDRQRFAARGGGTLTLTMRLFATPRMDMYLKQALMFHGDPTRPMPSADDDTKALGAYLESLKLL